MQRAKQLKGAGKKLGRDGLSERAIEIMDEFKKAPTYREAMKVVGRMKALAQAAKFDAYWDEQVQKGFDAEFVKLLANAEAP
jgi:hypothetical protein